MTSTEEAVIGEIPVLAKLGIGAERLHLYLTGGRLIVAHGGKQGLGALATMPLLGKLGAGLEGLVKGKRESSKRRGIEKLTPERILAADKDNFYFNYRDIVRIELEELLRSVRIIVLTKDDKLELFTFTDLDSAADLFRERLGEKVVVGTG